MPAVRSDLRRGARRFTRRDEDPAIDMQPAITSQTPHPKAVPPLPSVFGGMGAGFRRAFERIAHAVFALRRSKGEEAHLEELQELRSRIAELERERDHARNTLRQKAEFIASVGHEIRTPLNSVLGILNLLRQTSPSEEQASLLHAASQSGTLLNGLLQDMMDLSRLEATGMELRQAPFQPGQLVASISALLGDDARAKGLDLSCHVAPELPSLLIGDALRITQVMVNLVSNAIKFTSRGYVRVSLEMPLQASGAGSGLVIRVSDTGMGIPQEQLQRIFEPFQQLSPGTESHRGHGLGLSITRRLVRAMGGNIQVQSEAGSGTTFEVSLPLSRPEPSELVIGSLIHLARHAGARTSEPAALSSLRTRPIRVLVADDNPVSRLVLDRQLQKLGCHVVTCESGKEALELWADQQPDIVFSDYHMPALNGLELVKALRQRERGAVGRSGAHRTRFILVSAAEPSALVAELQAGQIDGYLAKPYSSSDLARLLPRAECTRDAATRDEAEALPAAV